MITYDQQSRLRGTENQFERDFQILIKPSNTPKISHQMKLFFTFAIFCLITLIFLFSLTGLKGESFEEKFTRLVHEFSVQEEILKMKFLSSRWDDESSKGKERFALSLFRNPPSQKLQQAQYYRLDHLYNISQYKQELPLCVSICGRLTQKTYKNMLKTVFAQKYSNYKVVFIDDSMNPDLFQKQKEYIAQNAGKIKVTQIYNEKRLFALKNRDISIRDHCDQNDIVVDLDGDDYLIGVYVFQLINTMYQRYPDMWAVYFTCIYAMQNHKIRIMAVNQGPIPDKVFEEGSYRNSGLWKTSELRTFRRKLYTKIDQNDYLDSKGNFYIEKADAFIHFSLIELAGKNHTLKIDEPLYYYEFYATPRQKDNPQKAISHVALRLLPPYLPLSTLEEEAKRKPNFKVSNDMLTKMVKLHRSIDPEKRVAARPEYIPQGFDESTVVIEEKKKGIPQGRPKINHQ